MPTNHEVNDVGPQILDHLIGQKSAIERVRVALEAAWNTASRFPHALFVGPAGVGKSALAKVVAREMGCEIRETLGQSLGSPSSLRALLVEAGDRDVVFIDECDELPQQIQTLLYRALEERKLFLPSGGGKQTMIPLANFTLLAACNNEFQLAAPLRDRFKLAVRFEFYSVPELDLVVRQRAKALHWQSEDEVIGLIAAKGRGTPRIALRLLESCYRTASSVGAKVISKSHFERTCELEGLDVLGLDATERRYLQFLQEASGPVRLNVLASRLGLPSNTVSRVLEEYLIREGFVSKTDGGRELTAKAHEHLRSQPTS